MSAHPLNRLLSCLVILLAGLAGAGCSPKQAKADARPEMATPTPGPAAQATEADVKALVAANNRFAFDLYNELRKGNKAANLIFSPYSLFTALAMTYAGARGETAAEMARTLHFDAVAKVHPAYAALQRRLDHAGLTSGSQLVQANALWSATDLLKEYTDLVDACYDGKVTTLNLANGVEASQVINDWVAKQTRDKIKDLVKPENFDPLCRLVLTNAIYFKGAWDYPFDAAITRDEDFTLATGEKVKVKMMKRNLEAGYVQGLDPGATSATPFYQDKDLKMVELVYRGRQTSMVCILPRKGALDKLALTPEGLARAIEKMKGESMEVKIPKFSIKLHGSRADELKAMGMKQPFNEARADFSGMTRRKELYVNDVIHQSRIDVDEQGSEAAAATAAFEYAVATPEQQIEDPPSFIADRPFLFLIRDRQTGAILFLGRVMDPRASA